MIDFLVFDHGRIKEELSGIGEEKSLSGKRRKMRALFRHLHMHEKVESLLFAKIEDFPREDPLRSLAVDFEKLHDALWILIRPTLDALDKGDLASIDRAFHNFDSILRAHLASEEDILFPKIRSAVPNAEPCTLSVPAILGAPLPITVRQRISVGPLLSAVLLRASVMAASTAAASWPSTPRTTFQP